MTDTRLTGAIELPDGSLVRGRGLRHPAPDDVPDHGLYLGSPRLRRKHDDALTWPHEWLDWPDFRLPRDPAHAVARIRALHARAVAGERVEVACNGGVGRTGTVIACLAVLSGVSTQDAVAWAREHYHHRAAETRRQRRWATGFRAQA